MRREYRISQRLNLWFLIVVTGGAVAGSMTALSFASPQGQEESAAESREVAANVNGKPIYQDQLKPAVENGLKRFRKYGMRKDNPALIYRLQMRALNGLIENELIYGASRKVIVDGMDEKVEQRLEGLKRKYGSDKRFEMYLKLNHFTMETLKESFRNKIYFDEYLDQQGILEPQISEEQIRAAYEANPEAYSGKEAIKVSHILIGVEKDAGVEEKEQALQKAEMIYGLLSEGEDFAEMAKKYSDCNSRSGEGNLRYIKKGYMPREFDKVAFALETGVVSKVVTTKFGYHIIKVFDKRPGGVAPYKKVRNFIKKYLQQEESKKRLTAHVTELKKDAKIELLLSE